MENSEQFTLVYQDIQPSTNIFVKNVVRLCKNETMKNTIRTLLLERGMSESMFYNKLGLSRQVWYDISWGRWEPRDWLKIKICKELNVDSRVIWPTPYNSVSSLK